MVITTHSSPIEHFRELEDGSLVLNSTTPCWDVRHDGRLIGFVKDTVRGIVLHDEHGQVMVASAESMEAGVEVLTERRRSILAHLMASL